MAFTRTPGGLAEKWRFHDKPTVWVEGPTDILFYYPIVVGKGCRMEPYHGTENAEALIEALVEKDYPIVVVTDGDYETLRSTMPKHRRLIVLSRYSFENYLWESQPVNSACLRHAQCGDDKDLVSAEMKKVEAHLKSELQELVALDAAARSMTDDAPDVLPDRVDSLLAHHKRPVLDSGKVRALIAQATAQVGAKELREAKKDLRAALKERPFIHLLNGHIVFGVLWRVFLSAAERESKVPSNVTHIALTQLLADAIWKHCREDDHIRLRRKMRSAILECNKTFLAMAS